MPGVARCPMCHLVNASTAARCERCGYEFGQSLETLRGMLKQQLAIAWAMLFVLLFVDATVLGVVIFAAVTTGGVLLPGIGFALCVMWTMRAANKIAISRHSLKLIDEKEARLPAARVVIR